MKERYKKLFDPIKINELTIDNRLMQAPTSPLSDEQCFSKAGVIILGCGGIDSPLSWWDTPYMFSKYERDKTRKELFRLKRGGSKVSLEIMHMGEYSRPKSGAAPGVSDGINYEGNKVRGLLEEELEEIARKFGEMAKDAKEFGFDMVMLHFAHGWLPAQFLSPHWNKRTDKFGGSLENRMRFPLMILKEVRAAVGPKYPVDMRISAVEHIPGGISFEDTLSFIKEAEKYIDMVNISAGTDMDKLGCVHMAAQPFEKHCFNADYSYEVKKAVKIPVAVVGSILTPEDALNIIENGKADLIMLGRALLADPKWIRKVMTGKENEIRPCLRCTYCMHWTTDHNYFSCSVNPRYLKEDLLPEKIEKADEIKNIVIIGGGPAGMMAAVTSAKRGHKVTMFEKKDHLGGVIDHLRSVDDKTELKAYIDYLIGEVSRHAIKVILSKEPSTQEIENLNPDVIFLAMGASPIRPNIPGIENAIDALKAYDQFSDLDGKINIIGGGSIGCELGLELSSKGVEVNIIEATEILHKSDNKAYDIAIDEKLKNNDLIHIYTSSFVKEIKKDAVILSDGRTLEGKAIYACGMRPNKEDAVKYHNIANETYEIGDLDYVDKIRKTVYDGTYLPYYL